MTFGAALGRLAFGVLLNGVVAWGAIRLARSASPRAVHGTALAATSLVFGVALVTITVTLDGIAGALSRPWAVLATAAGVSGAAAWMAIPLGRDTASVQPAFRGGGSRPDGKSVILSALFVAVASIPLVCDRLALPPVAWDSLTYHLQFPVLWLQTGRLVTSVPAVGDPAHTYYPLGGEMLLYWMLRSTGSDLLAFLTQIPFALLGAWAVATIALRCGARRDGAWLAALAWLGTPALLRQSAEPLVDVETASLFLAAIAFGTRLRPREGAVRGVLPAAVCLGLLVGAKYSGVLFAAAALPALIGAAGRGRFRPRAWVGMTAAASGVIALLGGYAYARNLVSGGTPFLPLRIALAGRMLAAGPLPLDRYFGPTARRLGWGSLLASPRSVLELGFMFVPLLVSFPAAMFLASRRSGPTGRRLTAIAASGLLAFGLAAILLPFREHRYFFGATGLGWSVVAAMARSRRPESWLRVAVPVLLLFQLPVTLFYWAKDAILAGVTWRHAVAAVLLAVAIRIATTSLARPRAAEPWIGRVRLPRVALVGAGAALVLLLAAGTSAYEGHRYASWSRYWSSRFAWGSFGSARQDVADAAASWEFVADATRAAPAVIAVAGSNLPYPLSGYGRRNRVLFVPRNGDEQGWRFQWGDRPPDPWSRGDPSQWERNLERLGVRYLCVYRQVQADDPETRFPVERAWAESAPRPLRLVWQRPWARIYEVGSRPLTAAGS